MVTQEKLGGVNEGGKWRETEMRLISRLVNGFHRRIQQMIETRGLKSHKWVEQAMKSDKEVYCYFYKVDEAW